MTILRRWFAAILLSLLSCTAAHGAQKEEKVVYHVNDASNATAALRNIRNHLDASPQATIVLVAHGPGIDFLLDGAIDKQGTPYDVAVRELVKRGVSFRVCNNTLQGRNIDRQRVLPEAVIVPSGVAELSRLQAQEGYVYIKP
ncbi:MULTISPECIES: DsrE family protein [unclassified Janthinobacterium]|uniref:DsrE family protein n=1 Tax=unclassified Janthinobacterium TaxID=2610881 RepID=UPI00271401A5|nr:MULTISPECIES: DsrE family protein [unclassified Janthinobacterium]MDO8040571.1 DsrE family protein [Janthinobacterium sp. SUN137]MDO8070699.1 DsrE family protein [Janthinobacterium sp. SUN176]MED5612187.1 DsrE family protein [Janthinobacterium sp. P210005]